MKYSNWFVPARIRGYLRAFVLFAIVGSLLQAQSPSPGSISGTVSDTSSAVGLKGAKIAVLGTGLETYTGGDGRYVLAAVPAGDREIMVSYLGYETKHATATVPVGAGVVVNVSLGSDVVTMEKFSVEGAAGAQQRALNAQRAASNITNEVSADSMGRLPDSNVAEALKRISSISLVANQQTGEGETVAIRGLSSGFNVYTVNGVRASTANTGNRDLSLNTMTADGLQGVTVAKTLAPDRDADAIGGTIDLRTPTGFDFGRRTVRVGANVGYNDLSEKFNRSMSVGVADVFLGGRLGVYLGAGWEDKNTLAHEAANGGGGQWEPYNYYPTTEITGIDPDSFQMQAMELDRWKDTIKRRSLNGSFDLKAGENTKLHLRFQHSSYKQTDDGATMVVQNRAEPSGYGTLVQVNINDATLPQPRVVGYDATKGNVYQYTSAQVVDQDGDGLITDRDRRNAANTGPARVTGGRGSTDGLYSLGGASGVWAPRGFFVTRSFSYKETESQLSNLDLGGSTQVGALTLEGTAAYSLAKKDTPVSTSLSFSSADVAPFTGSPVTFSYGEPYQPRWQLPPAAQGAVYDNKLQNFSGAGGTASFSKNTMTLLQGDARYDFEEGRFPVFLKTGAKYRRATRDIDSNTLVSLTRRAITLDDAKYLIAYNETGLFDTYNYGAILDGKAMTQAVLNADPRLFSASTAVPALTNVRSDKTGHEDVTAAYLMGGITVRRLEILGGARAEITDVNNTVWRTGRTNPANPTAFTRYDAANGVSGFADTKASYDNVTPSLHANYRQNDRLIYRGAVWTSIARPEYRYIEAGETYVYNSNGEVTSITRGNPGLKPATSVNYDLGLEYYTKNAGMFSLNFYRKEIKNFILGDNGESETVVGAVNNLPVPVSQPKNGSDAVINGVELTFQQQLRALPAPFDGLGIASNLTLQRSEAETGIPYRIGKKVDFMNSPRRLWNAALFYEKNGYEARFAVTYNGAYIEDLRAHAVDKWVQPRTQYDFKMSRKIGGQWRAYIEGQNLTNEHVYWTTHGPKPTHVKDYTEVGRTYSVGVSWLH